MRALRSSIVVVFSAFLAGGAGVVLAEPAGQQVSQRPNIILIVVDTLRADHVGCYGYSRKTTPNIDRLAAQGLRFERCYSSSSWTLPACTSLFTGLYAGTHGVQSWQSAVPKGLPFLPEILARNGYHCVGVSSNPFLTSRHGFQRGFHIFDDATVLAAAEWSFPLVKSQYRAMVLASTGATTSRRAMELMNDLPKDKPFFLFLHYMDCHADYVPPKPYRRKFDPDYKGKRTGHVQSKRYGTDVSKRDLRHIISLYDGEIAYTDMQIGQVLDHLEALGRDGNTLVIVTSDHGEEFLEHGNWGHGHTLYEECIRVPLIFRWPGKIPAGASSGELVSLVDVLPTILKSLNISAVKIRQGISLHESLRGTPRSASRTVVAETSLGNRLRAVVTEKFKVICPADLKAASRPRQGSAGRAMFFDLRKNPREIASNSDKNSAGRLKMLLRHAEIFADVDRTAAAVNSTAGRRRINPDRQHAERLKSLGY